MSSHQALLETSCLKYFGDQIKTLTFPTFLHLNSLVVFYQSASNIGKHEISARAGKVPLSFP